jgi:hypothetical protein
MIESDFGERSDVTHSLRNFSKRRKKVITKNIMRLSLAILLLAGISQAANAQYGRWELLGEANVDGALDHDRIAVGRADGRFKAIQIRVERAPIEFQRVVVHYGNGAQEELEIRNRIPAGGKTRVIDLRGNDRIIQSVEFWYSKANYSSRRPRLRLYGR